MRHSVSCVRRLHWLVSAYGPFFNSNRRLSVGTRRIALLGVGAEILLSAILSSRRSDVLIQMEQIVRIVLLFDLCETIIIGAVSGGHPIAFFFGHEVYVGTI